MEQWLQKNIPAEFNIFPGFGASTVPSFASLFLGWGLPFICLLDRDGDGNAAREKLIHELLVDAEAVIQPKGASTIEDLFSHEDFKELIKSLDPDLTIETSENPSKAIRRQKIDKALLARKYAERVFAGQKNLTRKSSENIENLLKQIEESWAEAQSVAA